MKLHEISALPNCPEWLKRENISVKGEADSEMIRERAKTKIITMRAEAQARANKILAASITKDLVNYEKIKKWDGKLPHVSGNNTPIVNLK